MTRNYVAGVKHLLPPGKAWPRISSGWLHEFAEAVALSFERVEALAQDLRDEYFPPTSTLLLDDWERNLGLPGDCVPAPTDIEERRSAVEGRLVAHGGAVDGSGAAYLTQVAASFGYDITLRRHYRQPHTCVSPCTAPVQSRQWLYVWEVIAVSKSTEQDARLACELRRVAINDLEFSFPLVLTEDLTFTRPSTAVFTHPRTGYVTSLAVDEPGEFYLGV